MVDGLISASTLSDKFSNNTGNCAIDLTKISFAPFKISSYADLKSLYFDQSKLASSQKIPLDGDRTQADIDLSGSGASEPGVITFDAASTNSAENTTSLSWNHTVGATGSNRFLLVGISIRDVAPPDSVSSITYAGQPLTKINVRTSDGLRVEMWYRLNPQTGTNPVAVAMAGSTGSADVVGAATSWTEVNQTNPVGAFASNSGFSTTPAVTVVSATGEVVVDTLAKPDNGAGTNTVGPGQTQRWSRLQVPGDVRGLGSSEAGASTVPMSWTINNEQWALGAVSIKPAPVPLDKIYHVSGNFTAESNITVDKTGIIFVDGDLTINNSLTHTSGSAGLVFVVGGDVNIAPTVNRVDAVIISSGRIYTAGADCNTSTVTASQLVINGSLISLNESNNIKFCRSLANNSTTPAEKINYQPKYLVILRHLYSDFLQKWAEIQ